MRRIAATLLSALLPLYCGAQAIDSACPEGPFQKNLERSLLQTNESPLHKVVRNGSSSSVVRLTVFGPWSELAELVVKLEVFSTGRGRIVTHRRTQEVAWNTHLEKMSPAEYSKLLDAVKNTEFVRQEKIYPHRFIRDGREMVSTGPKDGETWVLENFHDGRYRCVSLYAPTEGPLYEIGSQLLKVGDKNNYAYR